MPIHIFFFWSTNRLLTLSLDRLKPLNEPCLIVLYFPFLESYMNEIEEMFLHLLKKEYSDVEATFYSRHLIGLFYTSMSFCLVHSETYRAQHIRNGINLILNKRITKKLPHRNKTNQWFPISSGNNKVINPVTICTYLRVNSHFNLVLW